MIWNAVRSGLRLKLGLANPFEIRPQFCHLSKGVNKITAKLMQKHQVNSNHFVMRFALPDQNKCLGIKIGQYVQLHLHNEHRPYNPVSNIDEPGQVDFLITDLRKNNGTNSFTNRLLGLKENQEVELHGPYTQYIYNGYGQLQWGERPMKKYKHIGVIAFEAGITGAYTLIDSLMPSYDGKTALSLLWMGEDIESFIFMEEFSTLSEQSRLNCNLMLREFKNGWVGPFGPISKTHLTSFMPPAGEDTAIILIAGPKQVKHLSALLQELGHKNIMLPIQS